MRTTRRIAVTAALLAALAGLGGCVGAPPGLVPDSHVGYDRTFDTVLATLGDQRMTVSEQDRRRGRIVASAEGTTLVAAVEPIVDGTVRVIFEPQGESAADHDLVKRVTDAYKARMAQLSMLGGFKDSGGGSQKGPTPCPSGPALCP
jgi:hypothetical protein